MDSGARGGSMQTQLGCSGQDDQNATNSISNFYQHQHHHPHRHQFTSSSQHLQSPLTYNNNINLYIDSVPRSDLDQIWSMNYASQPNEQQQMLHSASSLLPPISAANNISQAMQDSQPKADQAPSKLSSSSSQVGKESGSSSGRVVKKRTRASRKTPTTVLTTDTTNFKSMVQEFTGIPTPPFGPSDPSLGSLLYSFNKSSTTNNNPNLFDPPFATTASHNTFHHRDQQQSQRMMLSGLNTYTPQNQNQNPNRPFQPSAPRPPFPSTTSTTDGNSSNNIDQFGGFSTRHNMDMETHWK